jgi:aspartate aminotransferase-like enzyme
MLPGPTNVPDRVIRAMTKPIINHRGAEFRELYKTIEENLKYVFQTKNDVFPLTCSGTGGVECAISNIIEKGDKVIVPVFGVFSERVKEKILRRGGIPIEIPVEWGNAPSTMQIENIIEKEKNVKAIFVVYNETSTGATVRDLPKIGEIARKNDILFIADCISILGGDELPVDNWNIDVCITGSQKCLACPPGLAMISVSEKAWDVIKKTSERSYYFDLIMAKEFGDRGETPATPALPLFFALDEALKIIREEGLENRIKRHEKCAKAFYNALEALELKIYPKKEVRSNTVISLLVPSGIDGAKIREVMKEKYDVVIAGGMGKIKQLILRIGCMGTISQAEVITTINALENTLKETGYPVKLGTGIEAAQKMFT